jgi:hypothetical protein
MIKALILAGLTVLGGCAKAVDDPANTPLLGHWQREMRITSVIVNDVWVDREKVPFALPADKVEDLGCVEPKLRTREAINRTLAEHHELSCSLDDFSLQGHELAGKGKCAPIPKDGATLSGTLEIEGREKAESTTAVAGVNLFVHLPDGRTERARVADTVRWTRLGDC